MGKSHSRPCVEIGEQYKLKKPEGNLAEVLVNKPSEGNAMGGVAVMCGGREKADQWRS